MLFNKSSAKFLLFLAFSGGLLGGVQVISFAQSNPGLTIFSGVERENILSYHLDFGGVADGWDRYKLRITGKKMIPGATKFIVKYPDYFYENGGKFDTDSVEVRMEGESLPVREVIWDQESHLIEIDLEQPIEESRKVELVFSNVRNPKFGGVFYFHCNILASNDFPIRQYVGTWIVSISR